MNDENKLLSDNAECIPAADFKMSKGKLKSTYEFGIPEKELNDFKIPVSSNNLEKAREKFKFLRSSKWHNKKKVKDILFAIFNASLGILLGAICIERLSPYTHKGFWIYIIALSMLLISGISWWHISSYEDKQINSLAKDLEDLIPDPSKSRILKGE